jgi:hypothetical protein
MLHQISWLQFSITVAIITVLWYISVLLLFFKEEIKNFLRSDQINKIEPPPVIRPHEQQSLMGLSKLPEGVSETYEIGFGARPSDKVYQMGELSDFLEETKDIIQIVQNEGGGKEELLEMLAELLKHFPEVKASEHREAMIDHIRKHSPFKLSIIEIEAVFQPDSK